MNAKEARQITARTKELLDKTNREKDEELRRKNEESLRVATDTLFKRVIDKIKIHAETYATSCTGFDVENEPYNVIQAVVCKLLDLGYSVKTVQNGLTLHIYW